MSDVPEKSRIFIVAGETSGDLLAADLVKNLRSHPIEIRAMGGKHLREAGAHLDIDSTALGVVGIFEVLKHLKDIRSAFNAAKRIINELKPNLVVLVDYPDFNLRLAKIAN